jgi:TetR/AcrR family transcriptional regulator, upper aerobic nicotinate degradation pathway regulator
MDKRSATFSADANKKLKYSAEKLLRTALELFASKGFASVTIKDIASQTNVNTALIYYYFESKEHLFRAAIEFAIKTAIERYSKLRARHTDPVFLIREWFQNNLEMADVVRQLVKIMLDYAGASQPNPSMETLIREFYSMEQEQILAESIRRGVKSGVFRKVDAARAGSFVSVHLDGIMVASVIRADFDMRKALMDLETVLWKYLDYDVSKKPRKPIRRPGRQAG